MVRIAHVLPACIAVLLATAIAYEVAAGLTTEPLPALPARPRPITVAEMPQPDTEDGAAWVKTILARPLFSPTRRPSSAMDLSGSQAPSANLPRLAGILVSPQGRSALFAPSEGGKLLAVVEGGSLGSFTVKAIDTEQVSIAGPDGLRVLHPSFASSPPNAARFAPPPPPALSGSGPPFEAPVRPRVGASVARLQPSDVSQ